MAKTDINIPGLGGKFVDLRDTLPGDAYNWSWERPLSQVQFLAIHASAGPDTQTPEDLAVYHINNNGWGGIGYHFVIGKDGTCYYVGDLQTARANVADLNEKVIGICLVGNFGGDLEPTFEQLDSTRKLCDFLINDCPQLININSWDSLQGHRELPGQSTVCPGDNWVSWKQKMIHGNPLKGNIVFNNPAQPVESHKSESSENQRIRGISGSENQNSDIPIYRFSDSPTPSELSESPASLQGQISMLEETVAHQKTQIENLQMSLATVNGQLISCRESLLDAEAKPVPSPIIETQNILPEKGDNTLTLIDALVKLYKFILPGKSKE